MSFFDRAVYDKTPLVFSAWSQEMANNIDWIPGEWSMGSPDALGREHLSFWMVAWGDVSCNTTLEASHFFDSGQMDGSKR